MTRDEIRFVNWLRKERGFLRSEPSRAIQTASNLASSAAEFGFHEIAKLATSAKDVADVRPLLDRTLTHFDPHFWDHASVEELMAATGDCRSTVLKFCKGYDPATLRPNSRRVGHRGRPDKNGTHGTRRIPPSDVARYLEAS